MKQSITVRQQVEALDEQIIPLINEGMFLDGEIHIDDIDFYLIIRNCRTPPHEYFVSLGGQSEFFEEECCFNDSATISDLVRLIEEFRSNPYQFAETYGD